MIEEISRKLFNLFVVNKRYFAIQKNNKYYAKNQYINNTTIENILKNKNSFLCYQENYNYLKWICFDFDINSELKEDFQKDKKSYYNELLNEIKKLKKFLDKLEIDCLYEFSGNRGFHIWILFDSQITRQDGFIIFQQILINSEINLNFEKFSLDKYPKSYISLSKTDKGTGVKLPLSFHQKSKKYSILISPDDLDIFEISMYEINELTEKLITKQIKLLDNYKKQNKHILFEKLGIKKELFEKEIKKENNIKTSSISFDENNIKEIIGSLSNCSHLNIILNKKKPSEKERKIIVGLLGQVKKKDEYIGKKILTEFFLTKEDAKKEIINERLRFCTKFLPPTCEYFRTQFNINCFCKDIKKTPLEFLSNFKYSYYDQFMITNEYFNKIIQSQINYSKQNDEILLFHTINSLKNLDLDFLREDFKSLILNQFKFGSVYEFNREEESKIRKLCSLSARDKFLTTYSISILDALLYKDFSSHSYGYKFNSTFKKNEIFDNWFIQWNMYISQLKTLIFSEDFKNYYILKLDLKSFYNNVNLQKLQIELNYNINLSFENKIINEEQKNYYFNIVSQLINFSSNITGEDNGLPQGPAFARYLAEYYLTSLDQLIEYLIADEGFYYRYVDDIFIILPSLKEINLVEKEIIEHLNTKKLLINEEKKFKGKISNFYEDFKYYLNDTKYFINIVDKNKNIFTSKKIHEVSSELIKLVENKDNKINDKNLTFLFTHLDDNELIINKRNELESYIITESKVRGSFLGVFWKYYFNKYKLEEINLHQFEQLTGLKRETFLNCLLLKIRNKEEIGNLDYLKILLNKYLEKEPTKVEKLLLLALNTEIPNFINEKIIDYVRYDMDLLDDFINSKYVKKIDSPFIDIYEESIKREPFDKKIDYIHNLFFKTEKIDIEIIKRFSSIFVDIINTEIRNNDEKIKIEYLSTKNNIIKYIEILYISTLFYQTTEVEFESIYPLWKNLLWNLHKCELLTNFDISKRSFWKEKINELKLEKSNIHFIMPLIKIDNYKLTNGYIDKISIIDNYFNCLIELIYLSQDEALEITEDLKQIKEILIKEKNVIYLDWVDNIINYYPSKEICIRNSIFNDITILRKDNRILVRLNSDLELKEDISLFKNKEESKELIFNGKYKTIIYEFCYTSFEEMNFGDDIYETIKKIILVKNELNQFVNKHFDGDKYINFFYDKYIHSKGTNIPLIPYDGFSKYFLMENDEYNHKNKNTYLENILDLIKKKNYKFIADDSFEVFNTFENSFFPTKILNLDDKICFLEKFNSQLTYKPNNIFQLDQILVHTIYVYLLDKDTLNIYNFFDLYTSFNRNEKKYLLFDYHLDDLKDLTLSEFFITIKNSIDHDIFISDCLKDEIEKIESIGYKLENYKKIKLSYTIEDDEYIITINTNEVLLTMLKQIRIDLDELTINEVDKYSLKVYDDNEYTYAYYDGHNYYLIKIPDVLAKVYTIIKSRSRAKQKVENTILFRPMITLDEMIHYDYFNEAVNVLVHHYKYSDELNSKSKIQQHLVDWLRPFNSQQVITAILCIISKHKYFKDEDVVNYLKTLIDYKNTNNYIISNIKDSKDNNGTHRLIQLNPDTNLWRELDIVGLTNFPKHVLDNNRKKIVFIVDIILSGTQIKDAFEECYFNNEYTKEIFINKKYQFIEESDFDTFKNYLKSFEEIIFHSIYYTKEGLEEIESYFENLKDCNIRPLFTGKELNLNELRFGYLNVTTEKDMFKSITKDRNFMEKQYFTENPNDKYESSEINDNMKKYNKRNIFVRFNSTPFKRFNIFTLVPKYYHRALFQYKTEIKK